MKLSACPLLADQNIDSDVVAFLRDCGQDIVAVRDIGFLGRSDEDVLGEAVRQGRAMLTHDRDFGDLVIARRLPMAGIILVRPGHVDARHTIETIRAVRTTDPDLPDKFVLVMERHRDEVVFRIRHVRD